LRKKKKVNAFHHPFQRQHEQIKSAERSKVKKKERKDEGMKGDSRNAVPEG